MDVLSRMNHFRVPGVSVAYFDEGAIRWSRCFGVLENNSGNAVTGNSIFHACSISKMITALCVLVLVQENKLSLYTDVNEYLTTWKIPACELLKRRKVTLVNLLSHQAGFYDVEGSFEPYRKGDAVPSPIEILRGTTAYNKEEVRVKYEPETRFAYSDAGYCIISQIINDVFSESIPRIAKRYIFDSLGLEKTFFWEIDGESSLWKNIDKEDCASGHDSSGNVVEGKIACYPNIEGAALWTTPIELSTIALDLLASYHGAGGKVLNTEIAKLMLMPYGCSGTACLGIFYDKKRDCYFSQGWGVGMQCKMRLYPKRQRGIVAMTNSEQGMEQDKALVGEIIDFVYENGKIE